MRAAASFDEIYDRVRVLGEGAYGTAFLVRRKDAREFHVAKEIRTAHLTEKQREGALAESNLLRMMKHSNIIAYVDSFLEGSKMLIVMEYADGGDLAKKIQGRKDDGAGFQEREIMFHFVQVALALDHIHKRKVLHRDLKPLNIFLTTQNVVKLGDFGIARVLDSSSAGAQTTIGTPFYLSPEVCNNEPYGRASDIWSLGVVTYELAALRVPFHATSMPATALKIIGADPDPLPQEYSPDLARMVFGFLEKEPVDRLRLDAALRMPFVQKYIQANLSHTMQPPGSGGREPPREAAAPREAAPRRQEAQAQRREEQQQRRVHSPGCGQAPLPEAGARISSGVGHGGGRHPERPPWERSAAEHPRLEQPARAEACRAPRAAAPPGHGARNGHGHGGERMARVMHHGPPAPLRDQSPEELVAAQAGSHPAREAHRRAPRASPAERRQAEVQQPPWLSRPAGWRASHRPEDMPAAGIESLPPVGAGGRASAEPPRAAVRSVAVEEEDALASGERRKAEVRRRAQEERDRQEAFRRRQLDQAMREQQEEMRRLRERQLSMRLADEAVSAGSTDEISTDAEAGSSSRAAARRDRQAANGPQVARPARAEAPAEADPRAGDTLVQWPSGPSRPAAAPATRPPPAAERPAAGAEAAPPAGDECGDTLVQLPARHARPGGAQQQQQPALSSSERPPASGCSQPAAAVAAAAGGEAGEPSASQAVQRLEFQMSDKVRPRPKLSSEGQQPRLRRRASASFEQQPATAAAAADAAAAPSASAAAAPSASSAASAGSSAGSGGAGAPAHGGAGRLPPLSSGGRPLQGSPSNGLRRQHRQDGLPADVTGDGGRRPGTANRTMRAAGSPVEATAEAPHREVPWQDATVRAPHGGGGGAGGDRVSLQDALESALCAVEGQADVGSPRRQMPLRHEESPGDQLGGTIRVPAAG